MILLKVEFFLRILIENLKNNNSKFSACDKISCIHIGIGTTIESIFPKVMKRKDMNSHQLQKKGEEFFF